MSECVTLSRSNWLVDVHAPIRAYVPLGMMIERSVLIRARPRGGTTAACALQQANINCTIPPTGRGSIGFMPGKVIASGRGRLSDGKHGGGREALDYHPWRRRRRRRASSHGDSSHGLQLDDPDLSDRLSASCQTSSTEQLNLHTLLRQEMSISWTVVSLLTPGMLPTARHLGCGASQVCWIAVAAAPLPRIPHHLANSPALAKPNPRATCCGVVLCVTSYSTFHSPHTHSRLFARRFVCVEMVVPKKMYSLSYRPDECFGNQNSRCMSSRIPCDRQHHVHCGVYQRMGTTRDGNTPWMVFKINTSRL